MKLIMSLMNRSKNKNIKLLMVGDYDQNIYRWRGAKGSEIEKIISEMKYHKMYLQNTYRLSKSVAETAQRLLNEDLTYLKLRKLYYDDTYQLTPLN